MNLKIQIISLAFSFLYGVVFSLLVNINYRFLFTKRLFYKIVVTFVFIIDMALLYFIFIKMINNGIIHSYFLLMIILGFYITFPMGRRLRGQVSVNNSKIQ